jgi:hypothetical protein
MRARVRLKGLYLRIPIGRLAYNTMLKLLKGVYFYEHQNSRPRK